MSDELTVHLNRGERHAVEPSEDSVAVADGFEVAIRNHGDGSHVNLGLDGDLAAGGAVATPNPFVPAEETIRVTVDITTDHRPLEGTLAIATGYGQTRIELPVSVVSPQQTGVDTDPTPKRANGGRSDETASLSGLDIDTLDDPGTLALVALAALALVIALGTALLIDSVVVVLAVLVVLLAVGGGVVTAIRS